MNHHAPKPPPVPDELAQKTQKTVYGEKTVEPDLPALCRQAAAEGIVLLKNQRGALPLQPGAPVAVFGRVQLDYFYVGYGSGGDVNPPYTVSLLAGLREAGVSVDEPLAALYEAWSAANPPDMGYWAHWPRYFEEMPVEAAQLEAAAQRCQTAVMAIGRSAGESRENALEKGSYYLTDEETELLKRISQTFQRTIVLINSGSIMDLSWLEAPSLCIDAALYVWQGGMESGRAVADVLTGRVTPCGKLTDSIAYRYEDYPSAKDFLDPDANHYTEDIFVGYRYFETFAPHAVQFPFGYGLSYTLFLLKDIQVKLRGEQVEVSAAVQNTGGCAGKEVVQVYAEAPQGVLGKPSRSLAAFAKTRLLRPGESQTLTLRFPLEDLASYDDSGASGHKSAWVLEAGEYGIYVGTDVRGAARCGAVSVETLRVVRPLQEASPASAEHPFRRMVCRMGEAGLEKRFEPVPTAGRVLKDRILENLPEEIPYTGDRGIRLQDVAAGTQRLEDFVAQLSPEDLEALSHGDRIMDSPLGTKGNAGVFGGITERLRAMGVPPVTATDGPSGIRLQYYASLLPCGTALAASWDPGLIEQLAQAHGREMKRKGSDILLSPGMNIHRNPLCGRNFEYFSEDPLITGRMGAAVVKGIQKNGVSACPKHFACNNQETNRGYNDSRLSERALREIYLKGFEICIREARPQNLMTSYNKINGVWGHYNYDLCTTILRKEWNYTGCVMTDWWMRPCVDPDFPAVFDSGYRIRAQVDVLMPGSKPRSEDLDPSALESFRQEDGLTLAELQRGACNVLRYLIVSDALRRFHP
ncbi:MAG: beta-glucosidase [Provencibacterium sp.]|jgi:beta-glucosidase|nr:beta-glucosidase [Provencibacterium sp.]